MQCWVLEETDAGAMVTGGFYSGDDLWGKEASWWAGHLTPATLVLTAAAAEMVLLSYIEDRSPKSFYYPKLSKKFRIFTQNICFIGEKFRGSVGKNRASVVYRKCWENVLLPCLCGIYWVPVCGKDWFMCLACSRTFETGVCRSWITENPRFHPLKKWLDWGIQKKSIAIKSKLYCILDWKKAFVKAHIKCNRIRITFLRLTEYLTS